MSRARHRGRRRRLGRRLLFFVIAVVVGTPLAVHFLAGPAGVPDGWRPHRAGPPPLSALDAPFRLDVGPLTARVDEPVRIRVEGLIAGEEVVVRATTLDARDTRFDSWGRFVAGPDGRLDLDAVPPVDGTYRGTDGNGLLWSMTAEDDASFVTSRSWTARTVELTAETERGIARASLERTYPWNEIDVQEVSGDAWSGELWLPPSTASERLPAVVFLGGFGDGPSPLNCSLLASRGYVVLNVGYHAWPGQSGDLVEVPIEAVSRALDHLQSHPRVDGDRLAVWGISKGAELALLAASHDDRVRAVAAWAPSSTVFGGISFRDPLPGSSWTMGGKPLDFAQGRPSFDTLRTTLRLLLRRPVSFRSGYLAGLELAERENLDAVAIPVERIEGAIQLVAGGDDQMWPAAEMAEQIDARLRARGFTHRVDLVIEPDAGHHVKFALWPAGGGPSRFFVRGGDPESAHRLGRRAWTALHSFLADTLPAAPPASGD